MQSGLVLIQMHMLNRTDGRAFTQQPLTIKKKLAEYW